MTGYYGTTEYSYDANGNITRIQNGSETQEFTYDALGQLIAYTDADGNGYAYTYQNGNILTATKNSETYHTYAYADTGWSDLLTAFDGGAITYDNIGNPLTYHDGKTFIWTAGRRLSGVTDGESSYAYAYDGDGNRISKTVNGVTTEFVYVDGKLLGLKKGQDKLQFLYDETDTAYGFIHNGMPYYYDINLQGEIVGILDRNNNYVVTYIYDVWGALVYVAGDYSVGFLNPLRYRGYFYDDETGFYYLQSRYYDPEVGRFINSDRYVSTGQGVLGYNMFAYCNNNPVLLRDSTGSRPIIGGGLRDETPEQRRLSLSYISSTSFSKNTVVASLPKTGEPNSNQTLPNLDGTPKQKRWYGPDGKAERDRDYNHSGNMPFPHDHEWKDGERGEDHLPPSPDHEFSLEPIIGITIATVCAVGIVVVVANDLTGVGVLDDFLLGPLVAGLQGGLIEAFV